MSTILVFDFETSGSDPTSELTDVVQIAAKAIDGRNLSIIQDSDFLINIKPDNLDDENYYELHKDTVDFHCANQKISKDELFANWSKGVSEKKGWKMFHDYCKQYNYDKKFYSMPRPAGKNILNFDLIITDRLNKKYKMKEFFFRRDTIDLDQLCLYWFMFHMDPPTNYKMDTLRPYFGMSSEKAHDAEFDVKQECELIIKFLLLHKRICNQVQFRDSFLKGI